jgi:hypothetical protein
MLTMNFVLYDFLRWKFHTHMHCLFICHVYLIVVYGTLTCLVYFPVKLKKCSNRINSAYIYTIKVNMEITSMG